MGILLVLWTILKVILIILAVLILLVLLLVGVVLFSKISYGLNGEYASELDLDFKLKWLFGGVKIEFCLKGDKSDFSLKLPFGLEKLFDEKEEKNEIKSEVKSEIKSEVKPDIKSEVKTETKTDVKSEVKPKSKPKVTNKPKRQKNVKKEKKPNILMVYWQKYNDIKSKYDIPLIIKLTWKLLKDCLKALGIKKCNVKGVLGFEDPYYTGLALGGIGTAAALLPGSIYFEGNFQKADFSCGGEIQGRTRIFNFLLPVLIYVFKKPIFKVILDFVKNDN